MPTGFDSPRCHGMAEMAHTTLDAILEEFDDDPVALATEVLALRRVVDELRSLHREEPTGPIVVLSPSEPPVPEPEPRWPMRPRMHT